MLSADPQQLLTLDDIAALCQTGTDWIRRLVNARRVEHSRMAGQIRMTREQFAAFVADHVVPASDVRVPTRDEVAASRAAVLSARTRKAGKPMTGPVTGGPPSGPPIKSSTQANSDSPRPVNPRPGTPQPLPPPGH